jgi:hypothetical protein
VVSHDGELLAVCPPVLEPLQCQVLNLLAVPIGAYRTATQSVTR